MDTVFIEASWDYWLVENFLTPQQVASDPMPYYATALSETNAKIFTTVTMGPEEDWQQNYHVDRKFRSGHAKTLHLLSRASRAAVSPQVPQCECADMFVTMNGNLPAAKLFAIISTNYAHHYSWGLSRVAFRRHGTPGRAKVLLNFDNHRDTATESGTVLKDICNAKADNGAWGHLHTHYYWPIPHPQSACYASIGCKRHVPVFLHAEYSPFGLIESVDALGGPFNGGGQDSDVLEALGQKVGGQDWDLYITVDRDVFKAAVTHFNQNGNAAQGDVIHWLGAIAQKSRSINLVGFDIAGLPPSGSSKNAIQDAVNDVLFFYRYARHLLISP